MQSAADKEFQRNVMNFKETLQGKTTWEELEAYVGYKLEKRDRFKAFILAYLNRYFEPLDFDDGREYYCTQKGCKWLATSYENNKEVILKQQVTYRDTNLCF